MILLTKPKKKKTQKTDFKTYHIFVPFGANVPQFGDKYDSLHPCYNPPTWLLLTVGEQERVNVFAEILKCVGVRSPGLQ